jgi:L-iditol 2-dehydrogenase
MKALVKTAKGVGHIEYTDFPEPEPGPGQVKIRVKACGICGTDLHIQHDSFPNFPPVVMGHEFSGVIESLGPGAKGVAVGQRVVSEVLYDTCRECRACKTGYDNLCLTRRGLGWAANGAFATFTVVDADRVHPIPDTLSFEEAALAEPLACCVCAVCELTQVTAGDVVLVSGPGPMGLLTVQCALAEGGYVVVTGIASDALRLQLALDLGAHEVLNVQTEDVVGRLRELTGGLGADVVFECSGAAAAARTGLQAARKGGKYSQVGLFGRPVELELDQVVLKELRLYGTFSSNWRGWDRGLRLAAQRRVRLRPIVSHIFPLPEWEKAFELASSGQGLKILLVPAE